MTCYTVGLDLGQARDYSALAVVERVLVAGPGQELRASEMDEEQSARVKWRSRLVSRYEVRHLQRWELGTPYPAVVDEVAALVSTPELNAPLFMFDRTGVGRAVEDMFLQAWRDGRLQVRYGPQAMTITSGEHSHGNNVTKTDLVGKVQAVLQEGQLKVAEMPLADALQRELLQFRAKYGASGHAKFEAYRESDHDDLVMALALALVWDNPTKAREVGVAATV